jgi:hypothetical protein
MQNVLGKGISNQNDMRFHFTPARMAVMNNTNSNKCWWGCRENGSLSTVGGNVN